MPVIGNRGVKINSLAVVEDAVAAEISPVPAHRTVDKRHCACALAS
jgi:hypothetical protein